MLMNAFADIPPPHSPSKLKARRLLLGLSQRSVAQASRGRLTRDGLSRVETGDAWPNPLQMQALADVYACSRETICEEAMLAQSKRAHMNLVHLRLRRGEAIAEPREVAGTGILYFCAKGLCPHYQGQLALVTGAESMLCALAQAEPDRICQPFYLEVAEDLDRTRRQTWEQRLAEAEAFESAVARAATREAA